MSDTIITVENLSKRYKLGVIGATSLRESVERGWHKLRGRDWREEMGKVGGANQTADCRLQTLLQWMRGTPPPGAQKVCGLQSAVFSLIPRVCGLPQTRSSTSPKSANSSMQLPFHVFL